MRNYQESMRVIELVRKAIANARAGDIAYEELLRKMLMSSAITIPFHAVLAAHEAILEYRIADLKEEAEKN